MQFEWTNKLTDAQFELLRNFYLSLPFVHIEQYPCWNDINPTDAKVNYCLATIDGVLKGYTTVYEYKRIEARIIFGPLTNSIDVNIATISEAVRYYKAKRYFSLQVLLSMSVGTEATYLQYTLYKKHPFKWYIDKLNKGTLLLKLNDKSEDELFKGFSENHRRAIRKAEKNNLRCRKLITSADIEKFATGYYEMYLRRGIKIPVEKNLKGFISIYDWLMKENKGFFMGVYYEEIMIGGILILFRGERAEYYRGFTLPDEKKLPIGHIAFYEAMKLVKQEAIPYFDFGGYNILVDEKDQVYQINKFKKGFHGEYFFYPPTMYFDLKPMGTTISSYLKKIRKIIPRKKK